MQLSGVPLSVFWVEYLMDDVGVKSSMFRFHKWKYKNRGPPEVKSLKLCDTIFISLKFRLHRGRAGLMVRRGDSSRGNLSQPFIYQVTTQTLMWLTVACMERPTAKAGFLEGRS